MITLLKSIATTIISIVQFVINSITSLINFFLHLPEYIAFLTSSINLLPSVIIPFALASVSIFVIFLVIDRGASS